MFHPGIELAKQLRERNLTQKDMATLCGKNTSELNEIIKGKRNFTIQRDLILHEVLGTPEQFWIHQQVNYEYEVAKQTFDNTKLIPYQTPDTSVSEREKKIEDTTEKVIEDTIEDEEFDLQEETPHHEVFEAF